jgi:hypothetical protein
MRRPGAHERRRGRAVSPELAPTVRRVRALLRTAAPGLRQWLALNLALLTVAMLQRWRGARSGHGHLTLAAVSRAVPLAEREKVRSKRLARLLRNPHLIGSALTPLLVRLALGPRPRGWIPIVLDQPFKNWGAASTGNHLTQTYPSRTITYTWDDRNRLTGMAGPSINASFAYEGLGCRAQKMVGSLVTAFFYDGLDVAQESSGGSAPNCLRTLSIDEALVRADTVDSTHYLGDALGSSVALTTPGGTAATTYTYEPFGRTDVGGTPNTNPFRFTGREDDSTGLYYYRAR